MKTLYPRLFTFFVGIPAIVCMVLFLPHQHHLALNTLITAFSVIGSFETASFHDRRNMPRDAILPIICGALFPIAAYLEISDLIEPTVNYLLLPLLLWIILLARIFPRDETHIKEGLSKTGSDLVIALYPGVLAGFLVRITALPQPELAFLIFFVAVFANDSMAYVFGILFGKNNRGLFSVSTAKSVAGLVAGLFFAVASTLIFFIFFPEFFGSSIVLTLAVGIGVGVATVAGDLVESAFKRAAGVKDSGHIIPGRGGILDSIDSVVFAAPVFFILIYYFA